MNQHFNLFRVKDKIFFQGDDANTKLELSFEYLMANGEMQWITLVSSQAIIMSLCLQVKLANLQ